MIQVYSSSYNYNLNFDMPTAIPTMPRGRPNTQQIKEALATGKLPERESNDRGNRKKCNASILDRKKPTNDGGKYLVYWAVFFVHRSMGRGYYVYRDRNDVCMQRHGAKAWELSTET